MKRLFFIFLILCPALVFFGCTSGGTPAAGDDINRGESISAVEKSVSSDNEKDLLPVEEKDFSNGLVWIAYWDTEDYVSKLAETGFDTESICIFEAYFDEKGSIVYNDASRKLYEDCRATEAGRTKKYFLSFVNDVVGPSSTEQKDTKVLYSVLEDPKGHAQDIVALAEKNGYDGVEIDYERIRDDKKLWKLFLDFEEELIKLCDEVGLDVRVVLEPSTPVLDLDFPGGPEYVVMCYNLFGYGTEPGPKADRAFLEKLVTDFEALPGDTGYALANGGFDWDLTDDSVVSLTALDSSGMLAGNGDVRTDPDSGVLHFEYEKDGHKHEVWCADDSTMAFWKRVIEEKAGRKVRFSLWRI